MQFLKSRMFPVTEGRVKADAVILHRNPSRWEVDAGGSAVQGHSHLPGEFEASLGYINKMKWRGWGGVGGERLYSVW